MGALCAPQRGVSIDNIAQLPGDAIELEKQGVSVFFPGTDAYTDARVYRLDGKQAWNPRGVGYPCAIVRPTEYQHVASFMQYFVKHCVPAGIKLCIAGGRHSNYHCQDDSVVLDMSALCNVTVDSAKKTVVVQGGANNGQIDAATSQFGMHAILGNHSGVGAGSILNAGVGHLAGKYGFACDQLISFKIVDAEGNIKVLSETENKDLFWAYKGAGWAFGVLLEYTTNIFSVPEKVYGGQRVVPPATMIGNPDRNVLVKEWRDMTLKCEPGKWANELALPAGGPVVMLTINHEDTPEVAKQWFEETTPVSTGLKFKLDDFAETTYMATHKLLDALPMEPWKSFYMALDDLPDKVVDFLSEQIASTNAPEGSAIIVLSCGQGAMAKPNAGSCTTALRGSKYWLVVGAGMHDPEKGMAWAEKIFKFMSTEMPNYGVTSPWSKDLFITPKEAAERCWGANLKKLSDLKKKYDSKNVFSGGLTIPV